MQYQDGGRYSIVINIERRYQPASLRLHGGDSEGVGCGACLGANCSLELLIGVGRAGVAGILRAGCLTTFIGDGGGGCRMTGIFGNAAGCTVMLVLTSGTGVRELMKNKTKSAMTGTTIMSTSTVVPSKVKRKCERRPSCWM
jgi:hypothetical protein